VNTLSNHAGSRIERKVYMQALELFLSRFHKDELWAECLKCGRRYENEEHRCDKEGGDVTETNKGASGQMENDRTSSETTVTHGTNGRMTDG
jgi:hypothetical protein